MRRRELPTPGLAEDHLALRPLARQVSEEQHPRRRGNGGWRLRGTKRWITNAGRADAHVVFASTDPAASSA